MKRIFTFLILLLLVIPSFVRGTAVDIETSVNNGFVVSSNLGITGGAITIICDFKPNAQPGLNAEWVFCNQSDSTNDVSYNMEYQDSGGTKKVSCTRDRNGISAVTVSFTVTLSTSQWYQIACTHDGTNLSLYYESSLVGGPSGATGNGANGDFDAFVVGFLKHAAGNLLPANGRVSNAMVFNTALTQSQIKRLRYKRPSDNEPNLVLYWPLTEGASSTVYDHTANKRNGVVLSSPIWVQESSHAFYAK